MTATLDDLLATKTAEQEEDSLLSVLKSQGFPVTDWEAGGGGQTIVKAIAATLADHGKLVAIFAAGGYVPLAKGLVDPSWLDLLAESFYGITRARATYTKQLCAVHCDVATGPQTFNTGSVAKAFPTGNLYVYQGAPVSVGAGLTVNFELQAESPGSKYADPANSIYQLVTPLPGLSINNPPTAFGGLNGAIAKRNPANQGSGTVTPSGSPVLLRRYTLRVTASGMAGVGGILYIDQVEAGVATTIGPIAPIPASYAGLGDGITLALANGAGVGFIKGDQHTFEGVGSPITSNGVDDESNESLASRCSGRWSSLGLNIVSDKYVEWIRQASLDGAYGIEKITPGPSATIAGQTELLVATATGAPSGGVISALQTYVNVRDGITDTATVTGATNEDVTVAGTVTVPAGTLAAVQLAADENWRTYVASVPIGGDLSTGSPGVVRLAALTKAVMDAGAIDYDGLMLNGAAVNLAMSFDKVAVIQAGDEPSAALDWVEVVA